MVWAEALKALALSQSKAANRYLLELSLFRLDGAIASEFTCAASKKDMQFAKLLEEQRKRFAQSNSCHELAKEKSIAIENLCRTEAEFQRLVKGLRKLPLNDEVGACAW